GGGRVAIFYDTTNLPVANISVRGGSGSGASASGCTIYLKESAETYGSIVLTNGNVVCPLYTPWKSALPIFQKLTLMNRAQLQTISTDNAVFGEVSVESNSILLLDTSTAVQTTVVHITGATLTTNVDRAFPAGTDLQLNGGGTFNMRNNSTLSVGVFDTTNIHAGTIDVQQGSRLDITSNEAIIGGGVTLVKDGSFGENDSLTSLVILNGGIITHSLRRLTGLQLHVIDTLEVKSGGAIDVSGRGLLGGQPSGIGGRGETYNAAGDSIVAGAGATSRQCAGASYGGLGANPASGAVTNPAYGFLEEPRFLGSGGGGNEYFWGGHGGGRVTINTATCIVDGVVRANGGGGSGGFDPSGGGSGGSIWITAGRMFGTGAIEAIGGGANAWTYYSGSGGGGRVAIFYDTTNLPVANISVRGGSGSGASASGGTIYLKDNAQSLGSVIIDNANINCELYTPWRSGLSFIQSLTVIKAGKLEIGTEINVEGPILVTSGGKIGRP
ncbi:MAG: hypothetical protein HY800_01725, partial [Ignavibacteriales bacterium]|nr:hypothetical protein [Ignavibacteriales bacterium]